MYPSGYPSGYPSNCWRVSLLLLSPYLAILPHSWTPCLVTRHLQVQQNQSQHHFFGTNLQRQPAPCSIQTKRCCMSSVGKKVVLLIKLMIFLIWEMAHSGQLGSETVTDSELYVGWLFSISTIQMTAIQAPSPLNPTQSKTSPSACS